jgi:hypothetical protein
MLYDYYGGAIEIKYTVKNAKLDLEYSTDGGSKWTSCITGKAYAGLKVKGYTGVSSANPFNQNVNDIDLHKVNFYNLNPEYYKHEAHDIVEAQDYYKRDENGYVGKTVYPWSAKLDTIELGKVAVDIFEMKRNNREFLKEQSHKNLHIITEDDDVSEILFKLNE